MKQKAIFLNALVRQTFSNMWRYKLRSFLTMFGIAWGVVSLVLMSGLCDGFREGQRKNMAQLGEDIVMVFGGKTELAKPGQPAGRRIRFTQRDIEAIRENCSAVEVVSGELKTWGVTVDSDSNYGQFLVVGASHDYLQLRSFPISEGRPLSKADNRDRRRVAVLGSKVREQLIPDWQNAIGQKIRINGKTYRVVGLSSEKDQNSSYDGWDNDKILIPDSALIVDAPRDRATAVQGRLSNIVYRPVSLGEWETAQNQVTQVLSELHNFSPEDENALHIWDTVEGAQLFADVFDATEVFLAIVALITLSLGGVTVMNTMMMAVQERTNEIGLKKALGASRHRILFEFFSEGLLLAIFSGLAGTLFVVTIASAINLLPLPVMFAGIPISRDTVLLVTFALGMVSVLSAIPPAWRASDMTPVEALSYER
jgi:putative ABC transport system permease protein